MGILSATSSRRSTRLLRLGWVVVLCAACSSVRADDEAAANRALVLKVNDALWNDRDLSVLEKFVAEDMDYKTPYSTGTGRAALRQDAEQYYAWAARNESFFDAVAAEGDVVFVRWRSVSIPAGEVQPYNSRGIDHVVVRGGQIVAWHTAHEIDSTARNKGTINALIDELWNRRDLGAVERHYAPDAKVWISEFESGGPDNVRADAARFFKGWSDSQTRITHLVAEGDLVNLRWETVATHTGDYGGIPATGKTLTYQGMDLFRLRDGKVVESWSFWDAYGVFSALGVLKMEIPGRPAGEPAAKHD